MKLLTRFRQEFGTQNDHKTQQHPAVNTPVKPAGLKLGMAMNQPQFRMQSEK
ncbi:hypothetical protein [Advenella mimigardefordensis]|uniref:hypothetical protein n=1 Tax=Advenella mimigardefordensis TaxID=302406 RepID=UPI0004B24B25|nr:hypothetical protein [Advenella mimigardefordensis]